MPARKSALQPTGYTIDVFGRAIAVAYKPAGFTYCLELAPLAGALGVIPDDLEATVDAPGRVDADWVDVRYLKSAVYPLRRRNPEIDAAALMRLCLGLRCRALGGHERLFREAFKRAATLSPTLGQAYALLYETTAADRAVLLGRPGEPYLDIEPVARAIFHQWKVDPAIHRWLENALRDQPDPLPELPAVENTWTH